MFQRTAQNRDELTTSAAADYKAARQRQLEIEQERFDLLAAPLSVREQVRILEMVISRSRTRFDEELDRRLAVINDPMFSLTDPTYIDALDPIRLTGAKPAKAWGDALVAVVGDAILRHVEARAKATGADRSKLTLQKKQADLARLEAQQIEYETAAHRALSLWRTQTGDLTGYP